MTGAECIKCGRPSHMGKECRTGWKYQPPKSSTEPTCTPSVKVMEGCKRASGQNEGNRESIKRKADGSIQRMNYSDSEKDQRSVRSQQIPLRELRHPSAKTHFWLIWLTRLIQLIRLISLIIRVSLLIQTHATISQ